MSAAAAMALVAARPSSSTLVGKSDARAKARLGPNTLRSKAFASRFRTLLAVEGRFDGASQEAYDNRAYPSRWIDAGTSSAAANAANKIRKRRHPRRRQQASWQEVGPSGVPADDLVVSESTGGFVPETFSGRATAIAISPNCGGPNCQLFLGTAGGGVWMANNPLGAQAEWQPAGTGIASNAIGSIIFDPTDRQGRTLYVGTGEPNGSSDSEAGVGLYKSTNLGRTWTLVTGSIAVATNRSIGAIAIDPANPNHIFIGTAIARHGSSSVNGGRFTPPGAPPVGLYESTNGGATFTLVFSQPQDTPDGSTSNGGDFFRGGISNIQLSISGGETQVYTSSFDYGLFRRSLALDGDTAFHQIFNSAGGGTVDNSQNSRTEFSLAPNGGALRIYVGDTGDGNTADFYRVDNANVPATTLVTGGTNGGWIKLSNPAPGTPGFASFSYCVPQCTYDMPVYSPPGSPDIVYIGGASQYNELFGASNGRDVQRSADAGVNFTDMSVDSQGVTLHPDQHAITAAPGSANIIFIADDGGIFRLNGSFVNNSSQCSSRDLSGNDLIDCTHWLGSVPATISPLNAGLGTLQFQSLSVNVQAPGSDIMGGTQDNGTLAFTPTELDVRVSSSAWFVDIFGDGGQSGINVANPDIRMHTFSGPIGDVNFNGLDELGWDFMTDPPLASGENSSFYLPLITDPKVGGTWYVGFQHVWRTQDNAGSQSHLDSECNEFLPIDQFDPNGDCGDWVPIGQDLTGTSFGTDKDPGSDGFVVAISRAPSDTGTLWVGLRRGRVFVSSNADVANANSVAFFRIDTSAQPERFVSGISVDASNPNHAFISYSGYNAYATASGTATGHLFEVTYNPFTHTANWSGDLAGGLGDQPLTDVKVDWITGDIYVSTDFGVFIRKHGSATWQPAASGLPLVAVYGLTLDLNSRLLYAATHGRGAWRLDLSTSSGNR